MDEPTIAVADIRNESTGEVVIGQLEVADGWWTRLVGLMLRRSLSSTAGLLIEPCRSIHMMFMRFPIDAIFIDRSDTVTRVARNVRPWTGLAFGGRHAHSVIELAAGAAATVREGDRLIISTREPSAARTA